MVCILLLVICAPAVAADDNTQEIVSGGNSKTEAENGSATVLVPAVIEAPKDPGETDPDSPSPKTGDASKIGLFIIVTVVSAGIIVLCIRKMQESKKS